jgi:signal transduction histidine kinase
LFVDPEEARMLAARDEAIASPPLPEAAPAIVPHRPPVEVLLIDDSPADHELYRRYLADGDDLELIEAWTPEDGLRLARQRHFDCVLLDYRMPRMDGLEVLKALHDDRRTRDLPVIMLTGHGNETLAVGAMHGGAIDYVPKDRASPGVFRHTIRNAVEKARMRQMIADKTRDLEIANETLRRRQQEIERVYHTISHEIKTPLSAAREFIAIVLDRIAGPVSEQQHEYLDLAMESCDQLASHFNDLLDTARLDTGKLRLDRQMTEIGRVMFRATAAVAAAAREKGVVVTRKVASPLPLVCVDAGRIMQVLANLLSNAIKFTPAGGRVAISAARATWPANELRVVVEDTGCGIAAADLPHIFDRLYQVPASGTGSRTGLGLGLSIARDLVRLHGGDITVTSTPGAGSVFTVILPTRGAEPAPSRDSDNHGVS